MAQTLSPKDHIKTHWRLNKQYFWTAWENIFDKEEPSKIELRILLQAIGAIRCLYWQALGLGLLSQAKAISAWWRKVAPLHQSGDQP